MQSKKAEHVLRREMVDIGLQAYRAGFVTEIEGNISARLGKGLILVSPHRISYELRTPADMVLLDLEGNVLKSRKSREPTSESRTHLAVYRARKDVNAVIHAHPVYSSAMSVAGEPIRPILDEVIPFARGTIEVTPFEPSGSNELGEAVVRILGKKNAVLLAHHGTLCVGNDLASAFQMTKHVEKWAQITVLAKLLGNAPAIPKDRQDQLSRALQSTP